MQEVRYVKSERQGDGREGSRMRAKLRRTIMKKVSVYETFYKKHLTRKKNRSLILTWKLSA